MRTPTLKIGRQPSNFLGIEGTFPLAPRVRAVAASQLLGMLRRRRPPTRRAGPIPADSPFSARGPPCVPSPGMTTGIESVAGAWIELVRRVLQGDAAALDALWRREHPEVYRLCVGLLADAAEADDLAQDAMLHLVDHLARWDVQRSWRAWRNTVVVNLCRDRLRRLATRRAAEQEAARRDEPATWPHPEDEAHRAEVRDLLAAALGALSEREREAFVLRDLQGSPTADVAVALGVTESTVRSLLTLARRRLRQRLGDRVPSLLPAAGDAS